MNMKPGAKKPGGKGLPLPCIKMAHYLKWNITIWSTLLLNQ